MMLIRSSIQLSSNETGLQRRPFLEPATQQYSPVSCGTVTSVVYRHLLIMPCPHMVGACLPSVPCLTLSRERKKLKIDKKEVHDTGDPWTHLEVKSQRPWSSGRLTPWPYLRNGKAYELRTWHTDGVRYEPHHRHARWPPTWKLWLAVSHHFQGAGTYCGGPTTHRTACISTKHSSTVRYFCR